jgi:hypothetical protein
VLIVALLLSALIALTSYLNLNLTSTRLAKRTFTGYAALNLAEAGTEEGVWAFNRTAAGDTTAWRDWTSNGGAAWQKFTNFTFPTYQNAWVKVYVDNFQATVGSSPRVVAQSTLGNPGETPVTRMIEVTLRRRSHFANGLVAKDRVTFNGTNASVDSWNSDPDHDPVTAPVDFSPAVRTDRGSVASTSVLNTALAVNQANVWGYVATGGAAPQVGTGGTIRGATTAPTVKIDQRRVSTDFNADFPVISNPTDGALLLTVGATLGTPGLTTRWHTAGLNLTGKQTLTILGHVILTLTAGSRGDALRVTGSAMLIIAPDSSLKIYTEGNITIAGLGLRNSNIQPVSMQLWGTNTSLSGQSIDIVGNGALRAITYAPNADITIRGNGDVMGSVVGRTITLAGNAAFHYDESFADYGTDTPSASPSGANSPPRRPRPLRSRLQRLVRTAPPSPLPRYGRKFPVCALSSV